MKKNKLKSYSVRKYVIKIYKKTIFITIRRLSINKILLAISLLIVGCIPAFIELTPEMRDFEYQYQVTGKNKKQIYKLARNHFAMVYGDARDVFSVQDEEEGTMIGKGVVKWPFDPPINSTYCKNYYQIRFDSEDGFAKLKINLTQATCNQTEDSYIRIKAHFNSLEIGLRNALLN